MFIQKKICKKIPASVRTIPQIIGYQIKKNRRNLSITQEELASMMGKRDHSAIAKWENGDSSPCPKEMIELCEILQITPNELFGLGTFFELKEPL